MQNSSDGILIREANSADAEKVTEVFEAAFAPLRLVYQPTKAVLARQNDHTHEETRLVAELSGQLVATVQYDQHEEHLQVIGLAVHPGFQRRGIAGCLLENIRLRALNMGRQLVVLNTIRETGNVPVFQKMGFLVVNEKIATWCTSEIHPQLHDVKMERNSVVG